DAQNQEATRRVGATSRRIASKIAEVLQTERPQRLCRKQTRRRHSRREDKASRVAVGRCPLWVISGHRIRFAPCPLYPQKRTLGTRSRIVCFVPKADIARSRPAITRF